jgi:hypothetical protein
MIISAGTVGNGGYQALAFGHHDGTHVNVSVLHDEIAYPEPVVLFATVLFDGQAVVGATVEAVVTRPDGSTVEIVLLDGGSASSGDQAAGDGTYAAIFAGYNQDGTYLFNISVLNENGSLFAGEELFASAPSNARPVEPFMRAGGASAVVTGVPPDTDGDGIPNDVDQCPSSTVGGTIVIDGCDTGVGNATFDDGCTMMDLIMLCADGAENHGDFVSCVAMLTEGWIDQDVITGAQKGKIQSCAARADLDGDGMVALQDLLILVAKWGECHGCNMLGEGVGRCFDEVGGRADLNADCQVDVVDLAILLSQWS